MRYSAGMASAAESTGPGDDQQRVLRQLDRMVAARFDIPVEKVEERSKLTLRVEDVTGPVLLLTK